MYLRQSGCHACPEGLARRDKETDAGHIRFGDQQQCSPQTILGVTLTTSIPTLVALQAKAGVYGQERGEDGQRASQPQAAGFSQVSGDSVPLYLTLHEI